MRSYIKTDGTSGSYLGEAIILRQCALVKRNLNWCCAYLCVCGTVITEPKKRRKKLQRMSRHVCHLFDYNPHKFTAYELRPIHSNKNDLLSWGEVTLMNMFCEKKTWSYSLFIVIIGCSYSLLRHIKDLELFKWENKNVIISIPLL